MNSKFIIAAAAAAVIGGAYANTCVTSKDECGEKVTGAATAHKVTISLKTPVLKSQTKSVKCGDPECMYWLKQGTVKVYGLIWAKLDDCTGCTANFEGQSSAFWTDKQAVAADFAIGVGLIDKGSAIKDTDGNIVGYDTKKVQAYGNLAGDYGDLAWAGFGTLASKTTKVECEDDECSMYVKSISGNIAGKIVLPEYDDTCSDCELITYAGCCDDMKLGMAAAYGTIKIAYDSSAAKKVAVADDDASIAKFVKLPKAVDAEDVDDAVAEVTIEE